MAGKENENRRHTILYINKSTQLMQIKLIGVLIFTVKSVAKVNVFFIQNC